MKTNFVLWWIQAIIYSILIFLFFYTGLHITLAAAGLTCSVICYTIASIFILATVLQGVSIYRNNKDSKFLNKAMKLSVRLGLFGTVLGLILLFSEGTTLEQMKENISKNMHIALYTTAVGVTSNILLLVQQKDTDKKDDE